MDNGQLCLLCFIDLSSAFDTVDHTILSTRLRTSFGFTDTALKWLQSFFNERSQSVRHGGAVSHTSAVSSGVPQGSVLGPLLFVMYITDIVALVQRHGLHIHVYADDVHIYGFCSPSNRSEICSQMSECLDSLSAWFSTNRLQLNVSKTNFLWCASECRQRKLTFDPIWFGSHLSPPATRVKCLGVILDSTLSFKSQVSNTVRSCFSALRQIRSIRRSLSQPLLKVLVQALVIPRLEYCIPILSGLPTSQLQRLQAVLHASARTIFNTGYFCSVTPLLHNLKWLPIKARIEYRLAVLAHRCKTGLAPAYLSEGLQPSRPFSSPLIGNSFLHCATSAPLHYRRALLPCLCD